MTRAELRHIGSLFGKEYKLDTGLVPAQTIIQNARIRKETDPLYHPTLIRLDINLPFLLDNGETVEPSPQRQETLYHVYNSLLLVTQFEDPNIMYTGAFALPTVPAKELIDKKRIADLNRRMEIILRKYCKDLRGDTTYEPDARMLIRRVVDGLFDGLPVEFAEKISSLKDQLLINVVSPRCYYDRQHGNVFEATSHDYFCIGEKKNVSEFELIDLGKETQNPHLHYKSVFGEWKTQPIDLTSEEMEKMYGPNASSYGRIEAFNKDVALLGILNAYFLKQVAK